MRSTYMTRMAIATMAIGLLLPTLASAKSKTARYYSYATEFACGVADDSQSAVAPGTYATAITLTNSTRVDAKVRAHVNVTIPSRSESDQIRRMVKAESSVTIDCETLQEAFVMPVQLDTSSYVQGILMIDSIQDLQVVVRSTAGGDGGAPSLVLQSVEGQKVKRSRKGSDKEEICHIPPGNHHRRHSIEIDAESVGAHMKHGDHHGECDDDDDDD